MEEVIVDLKRIFEAVTVEDARFFRNVFFKRYEENPKLEKALEKLNEGFEDAIQYLSQPAKWHRLIRSTNTLERLNQEVRRRERVIRIFPNTQSAYRLIGAVLMDYDEEQAKKKPFLRITRMSRASAKFNLIGRGYPLPIKLNEY